MTLTLLEADLGSSVILQYLAYSPVLTTLAALLLWTLLRIIYRRPFDPLPLIGHLHIFLSRPRWGHLDWFLAASRYNLKLSRSSDTVEVGDARNAMVARGLSWGFKIPGTANSVFTSDPACIKYVLVTKAGDFSKTGLFADVTKDMFGEGILVIQGQHWRMQRQAGKLFAMPSTLAYVHDTILPRCLGVMMAKLDLAAENGDTIDFQAWAKDLNLAIFAVLAFDTDAEVVLSRLAEPFDYALTSVSGRFGNPLWPITERFTAKGKAYRRALTKVKEVSIDLVEQAIESTRARTAEEAQEQVAEEEAGPERRSTLVAMLLKAGVEDVQEIVDSCINYTIAGRDTTAHALTWTMHQLLENPAILSELRATLDSTLSTLPYDDTSDGRLMSVLPTLSAHLPFLTDIFSESLRLHPPIPTEIAQHIGSSPLCLPSGQIVTPGEFVTWSPWVMARLPALWGSTAAEFDPTRWSRMREVGERKSVYELPTFHAGPRACLGKDMAKIVMIRTMEAVVRRYDIAGVGERHGRLGVGFTGEMEGGLKVRLTKRKGVM